MTDVEKEIAALKSATREAHEALADLKWALREGKRLLKAIEQAAETSVNERVEPVVAAGLDEFGKVLGKAIEESTEAVFKRFDTIRDTLLGEDKSSRRRGLPTIPELIERKAERDGK